MYAIVSSDRDFSFLVECYGEPVVFPVFTPDEIVRIKLDFIILEISSMTQELILRLHKYRMMRPETRIIIISPGIEPGDDYMARIVALGIYDILNDELTLKEDLLKILQEKPSYTRAARWLYPEQVSAVKTSVAVNKKEAKEKIIIKNQGLKVITVAGAGSGCGSSHLSLLFSLHLSSFGRVLLAEWPGETSQYKNIHGKERQEGVIKKLEFSGGDILLDAVKFKDIANVFSFTLHYDYLILDLGNLEVETERKIAEMNRSQLPVIIAHAAPYRWQLFSKFAILPIRDFSLVINMPKNEEEVKVFLEKFNLKKAYVLPYIKNWDTSAVESILEPVCPMRVKK